MPRFVILEHDHPEMHWDFMLEQGEELLTWKLRQRPIQLLEPALKQEKITLEAEASFPHRLIYLDYEGPISNGRGCVKRVDSGSFDFLQKSSIQKSSIKDDKKEIEIYLQGQHFTGLVKLSITN